MKANEAPERLYLSKNIYSTSLYQVPDPDDETAVEYIRPDVFIKRAKKWFETQGECLDANGIIHYGIEDFKDFKKAMKGE